MTSDIPMVKKAQPSGERRLRVRFAGDRRRYVLDLTGLIARSRHFAPLMADADFAKIDIVDDGLGVAWPVETKWGHLDLSGSTLRRIAEEQLPMSGADFAKWRKSLGLSLTEAAKLLGVGRRTIMGYLKKRAASGRRYCLPGACSRQACIRSALHASPKNDPSCSLKRTSSFCFVTASRPEIAHGKFPAPREKFPARLLQGIRPQMTEMAHRFSHGNSTRRSNSKNTLLNFLPAGKWGREPCRAGGSQHRRERWWARGTATKAAAEEKLVFCVTRLIPKPISSDNAIVPDVNLV